MKLQMVFGNPTPKKGLGKPKKSRKMKSGGNSVAKKKKKGKMPAALAAYWAKKRKKKHNPVAKYKYKTKQGRTVSGKIKYPSARERADILHAVKATEKRTKEALQDIAKIPVKELLAAQALGMEEEMLGVKKKDVKSYLAAKRREAALLRQAKDASKKAAEIRKAVRESKAAGNKDSYFTEISEETKMAKKKKVRKAKKAKKVMKPKKIRKARKAREARKTRKSKSHVLASIRIPAKKIKRGKAVRITVKNPDWKGMAMNYGLAMVAGLAYPWVNLGIEKALLMLDGVSGEMKVGTKIVETINKAAPGATAGVMTVVGVELAKYLDKKFNGGKITKDARVSQILDGLSVLGAAGVGMAIASKYVPQALPAMSGVKFFPMSGADFGTLSNPQSGADFGGVKYFPKGMSGVEFFPEGSNGEEMYRDSEKDDLLEAEGLGVIPEVMGSADFGLIPEGLGAIPEGMGSDGQCG